MYLVYKTDCHHSYASRDLIAACTRKDLIIPIIKKQAKKEGQKLTSDDLFNLRNISQTQGYEGEGEFHFEEIETNKLL